ncbi:hypothetical protein [Nocardioides sp. NPDC127503]|uniref:hypothetical protein n=1 Tax=Nocardioides sp. NPDC127503 TaxID=3154516 RepID=UPI003319FA9C
MYGKNGGQLRNALVTLLGQYRINHHLLREVTRIQPQRGVEARQVEASAQILRYRRTILTWCHQALVQADPNPKGVGRREQYEPPDWLRVALARLLDNTSASLPSISELTTEQDIRTLENWRQAAKAAALAEHDFDGGLGDGLLDHREWLTLVGDVADITKAIQILDHRYRNLPGWERLKGVRGLNRSIQDCATHSQARYGIPDYNIDWRGWHPPQPEISPDADTITEVLAAEHRLLNSLRTVPSMANLRHLLASQRELSNLAVQRARDIAPEQAAHFRRREQNLGRVSKAARTAGGLAGTGASATQHSADAVRLLVTIPTNEAIDVDAIRNLVKLFRHVDNTLCRAIEHGFNTRIYFVRNTLPRVDPGDGLLVHQACQTFEPLQHKGRARLIAVARRYLRAAPAPMSAPGTAAITRADFRTAINHRRNNGRGVTP